MTRNRGPLAVGVSALAAAVVLTVHDAQLAGVPAAPVAVAVVIAAVLVGALDLLVRSTGNPSTSLRAADGSVSIPGERIDAHLSRAASDAEARSALRDRIETVAIGVIVRETGCSRAEARDRLADGEWTDDELARVLFEDDKSDLTGSLRALVTGRTRFERAIERAVAVLEERDR